MSTKCVVKGICYGIGCVTDNNQAYAIFCDDDGSNGSCAPTYANTNAEYKSLFERVSFIQEAQVTSNSYSAQTVRFTVAKDGYYGTFATGNSGRPAPTFYSAGTRIELNISYGQSAFGIVYFGIQVPN